MSLRPTARSSSLCQDQGELIFFCKSLTFFFTKAGCSIFFLLIVSCSFFVIFSSWLLCPLLLLSRSHPLLSNIFWKIQINLHCLLWFVHLFIYIWLVWCSPLSLKKIERNIRKWKLSGNKIPLRRKRVTEAGARLTAPRLLRLLVRVEESSEGKLFSINFSFLVWILVQVLKADPKYHLMEFTNFDSKIAAARPKWLQLGRGAGFKRLRRLRQTFSCAPVQRPGYRFWPS